MKNSNKDQVIGFSPIINNLTENSKATVLILGSAPSVKSLENQEYYAHPQNAFWWIMAQIFDFDEVLSYTKKCQKLNKDGVIVWDVLASCIRAGSLDSKIQTLTETSNDIPAVLKKNPSIQAILCNGGTAWRLLKKHHPKLFDENYDILQMPSTSPAYAKLNKQGKLKQWRSIEQYIDEKR